MKADQKIKQFISFLSDNLKGVNPDILCNFEKEIVEYLDFLYYLEKETERRTVYNKYLQNKLDKMGYNIMQKAYLLENKIVSPSVKKNARSIFRDIFGKYFFKSWVIKYAYDKPQGYPGDYLLTEMVYDNKALSKGIGHYFDIFFLYNLLNVEVRSRKNKIKHLLGKYVGEAESEPVGIMDLGCGACREVKEWAGEYRIEKKVNFTCVDWDEKALKSAGNIFESIPANIKINFLQKDVLNIIKENAIMRKEGEKDLIYSLGLSNYLGPNLLRSFLKFHYVLLRPGGKLILSFWDSANPVWYEYPEWYCEWHFSVHNPRSLKDFITGELMVESDSVEIIKEPSGLMFFIAIKKEREKIKI